jgi:phosphoribosyl 1,2-cyclic phosphate phosphodiesterase
MGIRLFNSQFKIASPVLIGEAILKRLSSLRNWNASDCNFYFRLMSLSRRRFINSSVIGSVVLPLRSFNFPDETEVNQEEGLISVLFLGTGAADWNPKDYMSNRKNLNSGMFRGQSSVLINNSILIDCGSTVPDALEMFGINVNNITDILITHSHSDHFNIESLKKLQLKKSRQTRINLWVHEGVSSFFKTLKDDTGCEVKIITCFKKFSINNLEITPVEANHFRADTGEQCLHYILKSGDKTLFYALDGGWVTTKTWNILEKMNISSIIWDATWGSDDYYCLFSHNSIPMIRIMKRQLFKANVITLDSKIILTHLGRNYHPKHEILKRNAASEQFIVAFDGMKFTI